MNHCDNLGRIRSALPAAAETHENLEPCAIEPQECPAQKGPEVEAMHADECGSVMVRQDNADENVAAAGAQP